MKIASQRLHSSPPPNLCALRALCGESLRPFRITNLQIPLPATPFLSHPCKTPGVSPSVGSVLRTPRSLCCAFSCNYFIVSSLRTLARSCALFTPSHPLFSIICRLFSKNAGVGGISVQPNCGRPPSSQSGTAISGCPPLPSPCQLQCPNACGSKARRAGEEFSPARQCWVANQHTNFPSPSGAAKNSSSGTAISACPLQAGLSSDDLPTILHHNQMADR